MTAGSPGGALSAPEWRRKAVHAGMGLFALTLRWLDWKTASLCAGAALLFNLFAMPRIGRGIYRDRARSRDPGIVAYPATVAIVIVLFRQEPAAAAALWAMMAFGDPAATVAGLLAGGPALPWNPKKTWSGLAAYALAGWIGAVALWTWVAETRGPAGSIPSAALLLVPVVALAAFLESLESGLDDNWIPPIPAALLLAFEETAMLGPAAWASPPAGRWAAAVGVNAAVAYVTFRLHIVAASGAVAGAAVGAAVLAFGGWSAYAVLWTFFLAGTAATRLGYRRKEARGTAQDARGRRGARHVIANTAVPAALCVLAGLARPGWNAGLRLAFAGALAAALADTLGTELGSLWGRRPVSLAEGRFVPPGTPGAVSLPGIAGGIAGALLIAGVSVAAGVIASGSLAIVTAAGIAGSLAESLLRDGSRVRGRRVEHEFANAFNTLVGAVAALEIWASLQVGRVRIPFDWIRL